MDLEEEIRQALRDAYGSVLDDDELETLEKMADEFWHEYNMQHSIGVRDDASMQVLFAERIRDTLKELLSAKKDRTAMAGHLRRRRL